MTAIWWFCIAHALVTLLHCLFSAWTYLGVITAELSRLFQTGPDSTKGLIIIRKEVGPDSHKSN